MKTNTFLLIMLLLLLAIGLQSQTLPEIQPGIIGGLNIANFSGDDIEDLDDAGFTINNRTLFHLGLTGTTNITSNIDLRGEIALSMNGSKWKVNLDFEDEDFDTVPFTITHTMYMIQAPVSLILNFPLSNSAVKPYLGAGLSASIPVSSSWEISALGEDEEGDYTDEEFAELSSFVIGYQLNLGLEFNKILCEFRYERGLTPVFDNSDIDDIFYNNFKFLVGFRI